LSVLRGLWRLFHALEVRSKRMQRRIGVTGPQRLVIRVVGEHPDITAGEICQQLSIHASTLTGILARLQESGLLVRQPDTVDRRRVRFRLTARGRAIDAERKGTVESAVRRVIGGMPGHVVDQYEQMIASLVAALEEET
jgi:MarR family transcriptional regulator, organic hydroperoxide resistance regulator